MNNRRFTLQRGFTLIEIFIVVAIIAILSAIAVPQYGDFVTRGELVEAHSNLTAFRVQMEQYYQDNRNYGAGACGVANPTNYKYFTGVCVLTNAGQGFSASAVGNSPKTTGFTFTVDERNNRQTAVAPIKWQTSPFPPSPPCYITRKGAC
jgi:type IV pilus assembly protein PilE